MLTNRRNENSHVLLPARTPAGVAARGTGKLMTENVNSTATQQPIAKQSLNTGIKKRTALAPKTPSAAAAGGASLNALASKMGGLSIQPKKLFTNAPATATKTVNKTAKKSLVAAEVIPTIKSHAPAARKPLVWDDMEPEYAPPKDTESPELEFDMVDLEAVKACVTTSTLGACWSIEEEEAALKAWKEEDGKWREDLFEPEIVEFPRSFSAKSFKDFTPSLSPKAIPNTPPSYLRRTGTTPKLPLAPKLMSKEFSPRAPSGLYAELYGTRGSPISRSMTRSSLADYQEEDINWTAF